MDDEQATTIIESLKRLTQKVEMLESMLNEVKRLVESTRR